MNTTIVTCFAGCLVVCAATTHAYQQPTHAEMADAAVQNSVLRNDRRVLENLGLEPLGNEQRFQIALHPARTIRQLFREGAGLEDAGVRSLNHFFDPLHDLGLGGVNVKSPDWALEDKSDIGDQDFSLKDTYDRLYKALTLASEDDRMHNFGLVFENLGRVIHHIEDMAQPQHARNDEHCDAPLCRLVRRHNPSLYEEWTNTNREKPFFTEQLALGLYPAVRFDTARKFWHTANKNPKDGQGIAEFTNLNFVSAGTNFDTNRYPDPERLLGPADSIPILNLLQEDGTCPRPPEPCRIECGDDIPDEPLPPVSGPPVCQLTGNVEFVATLVYDNFRGGAPVQNDRASTFSIFDQDLKQHNANDAAGQPMSAFTLNRFNFQAAYPHLIPKAVAYSAGLIDYFFRGRLEVERVIDTGGELRIEVRNRSGTDNTLRNGTFSLYYDASDGARKPLAITQGADVLNLAHDAPHQIVAARPRIAEIDLTKKSPLILVYRGTVGQEEAVAAVVLEMPLSGFLVSPGFVPTDGIAGPRHIYFEDGQWRLGSSIDLVAGNVDWKGEYVNDGATLLLTWRGLSGRYVGGEEGLEIFHNGRLFAVAPGLVAGAAVTRDAQGRRWLVVVCNFGAVDIVYRRPFKRSESRALYDPVAEPDGWRAIGQTEGGKNYIPAQHWHFNADGNEAQTMKRIPDDSRPGHFKLVRLRLNVVGTTGTISDLGNDPLPQYELIVTGFSDPPPTNVCPSYTQKGGIDVTQRQSGSTVISVDYQVNTPVFGRAEASGTAQGSQQVERRSTCAPNTFLEVLEERGTEGLERNIILGNVTLPVEQKLGSGQWSATRSSVDGHTGAGTGSLRTVNNRGLFAYDLRHGVVAAHEFLSLTEHSSFIEPFPFRYCSTTSIQSSNEYYVKLGPLTLNIYSDSHTRESAPCDTRPPDGLILPGFLPGITDVFETPGTRTLDIFPGDEFRDSVWLVDMNDRALGVQAYRDKDGQEKRYHFLSDGDLSNLIPGGGRDATYLPVGVIQ